MTALERDSILLVRLTAAPLPLPDGGSLTGYPDLPAGWTSAPAVPLRARHTRGSEQFDSLRLNTIQTDLTKGLWFFTQREPIGDVGLDALAVDAGTEYAETFEQCWAAAVGGGATERALLRHVADWNLTGFVDDGAGGTTNFSNQNRHLFQYDSGQRVPVDWFTGPGPWHLDINGNEVPHNDPAEHIHVTTVHGPALLLYVAGYDDGVALP